MKPNLKSVHEFRDLNLFLDYVDLYMNKIATQVAEHSGELELHLISDKEVIGVWKVNQTYGFIEEYRDTRIR